MNKKYQAQELARQVVETHDLSKEKSINLDHLTDALNVEIHQRGMVSEGALIREGDTYRIEVKDSLSDTRKRFTIAHEVGHLLLNEMPDPQGSGKLIDRFYRDGEEEEFCNEFAAALLVPVEYLQDVATWEDINFSRIAQRADEIGVSVLTLTKRVIQEAPGEGGFLIFEIHDQANPQASFEMEWGGFPTEFRTGTNFSGTSSSIDPNSPLYTYLQKLMTKDDEYLLSNATLNLEMFPWKEKVTTSMIVKRFGDRIYSIVIPTDISPDLIPVANQINVQGYEKEDLSRFS